jgi:uncharacterized membrane protein
MFMKIYFWLISIFAGSTVVQDILYLFGIGSSSDAGVFDYADTFVIQIIGLVGLFGYVYKKEIGKKVFWKVFSVFYLAWYFIYSIKTVYGDFHDSFVGAVFVLGFGLVFAYPLFNGLFRYAYGQKKERVRE